MFIAIAYENETGERFGKDQEGDEIEGAGGALSLQNGVER